MNSNPETALLCPQSVIEILKEGNTRFVNNLRINRNLLQEVEATKEQQKPFAVIVSCMDSRTAPEFIFDRGLGDIFSIRIAGNVITPEIIGSVEYACAAVGSMVVVVLGHTGCGAIRGTLDDVQLGLLPTITSRIKKCFHQGADMEEVTLKNVESGVNTLKKESNVLQDLLERNELKIIGGIYDIKTGHVSFTEN